MDDSNSGRLRRLPGSRWKSLDSESRVSDDGGESRVEVPALLPGRPGESCDTRADSTGPAGLQRLQVNSDSAAAGPHFQVTAGPGAAWTRRRPGLPGPIHCCNLKIRRVARALASGPGRPRPATEQGLAPGGRGRLRPRRVLGSTRSLSTAASARSRRPCGKPAGFGSRAPPGLHILSLASSVN